jgi:Domain of unknown function (DUF4186)
MELFGTKRSINLSPMRDLDDLFAALLRSKLRSRFRLGAKEAASLDNKGMDVVQQHARDFTTNRLTPAQPHNDGKQTPMRGHPVFIAQHATATCCRSCLAKWHGIDAGQPLKAAEIDHVLAVILRWLERQPPTSPK